ncbi:MAG TPA: glycosyltransferase [Acidobacteriaceae bacterium]
MSSQRALPARRPGGYFVRVTTSRIVFLTREPVIHQLGGSTTYAFNLLEILVGYGADVVVVTTSAFSSSPLLWFRPVATLPAGVKFSAPGFFRAGGMYLNLFSLNAWARAFSRMGTRSPLLRPLSTLAEKLFAGRIFANAWDLTPPSARERAAALREIATRDATTVIANYAFWGPLLRDEALRGCKRVILMHDLLSARVQLFLQSGTPLDSPEIGEAEEMEWLSSADCVLAAQQREAEAIQPRISACVLVQPMVYRPRRFEASAEKGRCLFVGANIAPNQTGLRWFLDEVWPQVRREYPQATLAVVGTICSWMEDGIPGVVKLNIVPSIETEYARASLCVAPLRIGSGIKIKLIEALSFGKAAVSTSVGVQGLEEWIAGAVEVCDEASSFATAVVHLLRDDGARNAHEEAALHLIQQHYSAEALLSTDFTSCVL